MTKIESIIVDGKLEVIGFIVSGPANELTNRKETSEVKIPFPMSKVRELGGIGNQVKMVGGTLVELGSFKLNALPMVVIDKSGKTTLVKNRIAVTKQICNDGTPIGYEVVYEETAKRLNYRTDDLARIAKYFKAVNFEVYEQAGKKYLRAKDGKPPISSLPVIELNPKSENRERVEDKGNTPKIDTRTVENKVDEVKKEDVTTVITGNKKNVGMAIEVKNSRDLTAQEIAIAEMKKEPNSGMAIEAIEHRVDKNDFDLITLMEIVRSYDGILVKLREDKYISNTDSATLKADDSFQAVCDDEFIESNVQYNPETLSITANFRKYGFVTIGDEESFIVPCYVVRTKAIVYSGEYSFSNVGVLVSERVVDELIKEIEVYGVDCRNNVDYEYKEGIISSALGRTGNVLVRLDLSHIPVISPVKVETQRSDASQLKSMVEAYEASKIFTKFFGSKAGLQAEIRKVVPPELIKREEVRLPYEATLIHNKFEGVLDELGKYGINCYTGAYGGVKAYTKPAGSGKEGYVEHSIKYDTGSKIPSMTYKDLVNASDNMRTDLLPESLCRYFKDFLHAVKDSYTLQRVMTEEKKAFAKTQSLKKELFIHNLASIICGNGSYAALNPERWRQFENSRLKNGKDYRTETRTGTLRMIIKGWDMCK